MTRKIKYPKPFYFLLLPLYVMTFSGCDLAVSVDGNINPDPLPEIGSCLDGALANGEMETRIRFEKLIVPSGETCSEETQFRTCVDGVVSEYNGTFTQETCSVAIDLPPIDPKSCGALASGESESRIRFKKAIVPFGETCNSSANAETQTRTCNDGALSQFTGSFTQVSCVVDKEVVVSEDTSLINEIKTRALPLANETSGFKLKFNLEAATAPGDSVVALSSSNNVTSYNQMAAIVRLNDSGKVDARNGSSYQAMNSVSYAANTKYEVEMDVDLLNHVYSASISGGGLSKTVIAQNYAFRTGLSSVTKLPFIAQLSATGNMTVSILSQIAVDPPALGCGALADGETTTRKMFQASSVSPGQSCVSKTQTGTCSNGELTFTGTFTNASCFVQEPPTASASCPNGSTSQITQFGITWTFDKAYPCGEFVNGDYWVVGPVTLTNILPKSTNDRNGSMIGPNAASSNPGQGFDIRIASGNYQSSLNIAKQLPYTVPANRSVISSISYPGDERPRCQIEDQAVLTVLSKPAPVGSFRPTYFGTDKSIKWNKNDIDFSKLKNLQPVSGGPDLATAEKMFERSRINFGTMDSYVGNYIWAANTNPVSGYYAKNYGREISKASGYGALALNLNYTNATKEKLAIRYIQNGLDIYGGFAFGNFFKQNGGHNNGFKLPTLVAAVLLNDSNIMATIKGSKKIWWSEDGSHFYVTQSLIDSPRYLVTNKAGGAPVGQDGCEVFNADGSCQRPVGAYKQSMLGTPEWSASGPDNRAGSNWYRYYREITGIPLIGNALAVHIMGLETEWDHPAFLDYFTERAWPNYTDPGSPWGPDLFIRSMWNAYR